MIKTAEKLTKQEIFAKYATKFKGENILTEPSAMAVMEEYHNQFRPEWIPVSERLPENSTENNINIVLVVSKDKRVISSFYFNDSFGAMDGKTILQDVTHWMKCPEPPKE